jgi:Tol biopolymer transport system component
MRYARQFTLGLVVVVLFSGVIIEQAFAYPLSFSAAHQPWDATISSRCRLIVQTDSGIYLVSADSLGVAQITTDLGNDDAPVWSPDGRTVLLSSTRDRPYKGLFLLELDGMRTTSLFYLEGMDSHFPAWSPDGTRIAFIQDGQEKRYLVTIDVDHPVPHRLLDASITMNPLTWSPDGRSIAFIGIRPRGVFLIQADGSGLVHLAPNLVNPSGQRWSPDGQQLALESLVEGQLHIFLVQVDSGFSERIINTNTEDYRPTWSPTGDALAYASSVGEHLETSISVVDLKTLGTRVVARRTDRIVTGPEWSPDGQEIAYMSFSRGRGGSQVLAVTPDGKNTRLLADFGSRIWSIAWDPSCR